MQQETPEDPWDQVHLEGARLAEAFGRSLLKDGAIPPEVAHRHVDNAYVFVEYLANAYPRLPRDATERDAWLFLFDYVITQGPFTGPTLEATPQSVELFLEFSDRREGVPEFPFIKAACKEREFFVRRLAEYDKIVKASGSGPGGAETAAALIDTWWHELDARMWGRGLVPDASLAGGPEKWGDLMGPVEQAVFEAVCVVLSRRARELNEGSAAPAEFDRQLLSMQRAFMTGQNRSLGMSPLEAVLRERATNAGAEEP